VLLLDEIEKASPAVLDVLLPALGEARMTDARGRTVDLSGLLILMTSNLGTRESTRTTGFVVGDDSQRVRGAHDRAIRDFFRPEFFNRIDGVLHFDRLSPDSIQEIAGLQIQRLLQREGLQRRHVMMDVDAAAVRWIARRGVDTRMGARALKRQIERDLIRPAAETLAGNPEDTPILMRILAPASDEKQNYGAAIGMQKSPALDIQCVPILYEKRRDLETIPRDSLLETARHILDLADAVTQHTPMRFESGGGIDSATLERLAIADTAQQLRRQMETVHHLRESKGNESKAMGANTPGSPYAPRINDIDGRADKHDVAAISEIRDYWNDEMAVDSPDKIQQQIQQLRIDMGRLHCQMQHRGCPVAWAVQSDWIGGGRALDESLGSWYSGRDSPTIRSSINRVRLVQHLLQWLIQDEELSVRMLHASGKKKRPAWLELDDPNKIPSALGKQTRWIVEGVLSEATIRQLIGSIMMVHEDQSNDLLCIRAVPLTQVPENLDQAIDVFAGIPDDLPAVRRFLRSQHSRFDARTGMQLPPKGTFDALMKASYLWTDQRFAAQLKDSLARRGRSEDPMDETTGGQS
ncbi:MAG: AAA family ATPase, partial [Planctomycetota bacterium]